MPKNTERNGESSMNHFAKRSLSMLMALVLVLSLFSGVVLPASAASYTYNWGYRGQTATSLSSAAINFYSGTSYEELSSYTGSSNLSSVPSSSLYSHLATLMSSRHSHVTSYDETKDLYRYTDCQGGGGAISSFYSGRSIGPDWDGSWNREHTWPNSKGEGSAENDIMMLRPTSTIENSSRGNTAYGISGGFYDPNSESGGTYNLHGDVARIMLYVYVRWGNTSYMWGSSGVMESKEVLLAWMEEDPVDTWELGRNDAVQSITGTRNVFVDYPELAFLLFDEVVPANMTTPSGMAGASAYNITATSNDTAMGTVSVAGKNIQAVPAEGYLATGYELISGTAEVIRRDNTFVVNASSDCEIRILFAPKTLVDLTYLSNGQTLSTQQVYSGDPVTLPAYTGTAPENCKFIGWVDAPVADTETRPAFYRAGESYTVNGATTLYALFSYTGEGGESGGTWTLVTDASRLIAGDQIVFAVKSKGVVAGALEKTYLKEISVTFSDDGNTIPTMSADASIFTLGGTTGAWTLTDASGNGLGCYEVKKLAYDSGTMTWSISISNGEATVQNTSSGYGWIQYNAGSPRFTTYTSSQVKPQLYVLDTAAGSTFYTTSTCAHGDTVDVAGQAATCTTGGYTDGVYCNDCESYISGHETVGSLGHNYAVVVTPPTVTEAGYTTHTCGRCGDKYTSDPVPALGETYTVSFSVPADAAAIEDMGCNTSGILLPEADVMEGYTFLGWAEAAVDNSTEAPAYHKAGDKFVATANTTLYALYTYAVGGSAGGYTLVTNAAQLQPGSNVVIVSSAYDYAMSTTQNTNNRGQAAITKSGNGITFDAASGVAVLTLCDGAVAGTYAFYCPTKGGYLYAASSSGNQLKTKAALDANGSFLIEVGADGVATVTAQGTNTRNSLRHNNTSSLFACYASTNTTMAKVSLYVEGPAGEVYYTTNIAHRHSGTYHAAAAATCGKAGNVEYWSCGCGQKFSDSGCTNVINDVTVPQLQHSFTAEKAEAQYLNSEANCQSGAVYYLSCAECGASSASDAAVFVYGSTDPGTHPGEGIFAGETPATCTEAGSTGNTVCGACGEVMVYGTVIPATGHADAVAVAETASTCATHGVKFHFHCDACGGDYLEKSIAAVAQSEEALQLPLNPANHEGETELRNESDATCEADGYTGDTHCIACGEMLAEGEPIPGGHTVENGICTKCEAYGICGENLTWTFENGTLTVSGEGEMYDYSNEANPQNAPWAYFLETMESIVIEEGVTSVGHLAFSRMVAVTEVSLPDTLTTIGGSAFSSCVALEEIEIPASVTSIGDSAFTFCYALTEITFEGSAPAIGTDAFGTVTANAHYMPDASWTADVMQNYGGTITWVSDAPCAATVNGVSYETLADALAAAQSGDTVMLMADGEANIVKLIPGVTLDLNGYQLTAEFVSAFKGSDIVDNSEANTGVLSVDPDCMMISTDNSDLPVWNGEGYIFVDILKFQDMDSTTEDGLPQYIFSPTFESIAHPYLALGAANSHVRVAIRMTWDIETGSAFQNFVYNDATVKTVIESFTGSYYSKAFYATVTDSQYANFDLQVILISDTGVELVCN